MDLAKKEMKQHEISVWVNLQTEEEKFTALHYASFKGNVRIAQKLVDNGADIETRNANGLNVVHIAAQGD